MAAVGGNTREAHTRSILRTLRISSGAGARVACAATGRWPVSEVEHAAQHRADHFSAARRHLAMPAAPSAVAACQQHAVEIALAQDFAAEQDR
jgi:hypothetical protein